MFVISRRFSQVPFASNGIIVHIIQLLFQALMIPRHGACPHAPELTSLNGFVETGTPAFATFIKPEINVVLFSWASLY